MEDLRIVEVSFTDFRNHASFHLENVGELTVFVGPNGSGKTNAVEGVQLLTAHGSLRGATSEQLIRWGRPFARLEARARNDVRDLALATVIEPKSRSYTLNGKRKAVQDMQGIIPAVAFSPDDMELAKGPHAPRRAALDLLGCQLSRNHRVIKRDYDKLVRHKNALLRDDAPATLLAAVNDALVPAAEQLYLYRTALLRNLLPRMAAAYAELSGGERLEASYAPSWLSDEEKARLAAAPEFGAAEKGMAAALLAAAMGRRAGEERARKRALVGPHADRVEFFIDGRNASAFASQGQQRSLVLAWKIAEVGVVKDVSGARPVLLLDDVMSELDVRRRSALVDLLRRDIQTFITATDTSCFDDDIMQRADVVDLSEERGKA